MQAVEFKYSIGDEVKLGPNSGKVIALWFDEDGAQWFRVRYFDTNGVKRETWSRPDDIESIS
jgi:hypothetical protein